VGLFLLLDASFLCLSSCEGTKTSCDLNWTLSSTEFINPQVPVVLLLFIIVDLMCMSIVQ